MFIHRLQPRLGHRPPIVTLQPSPSSWGNMTVVGLAASRRVWLSLLGVINLPARGPSTPLSVVSIGVRLDVSVAVTFFTGWANPGPTWRAGVLFCLTLHPQTYPAWLDPPGAQGSCRYSSGDHKSTQASPPQLGTVQRKVRLCACTYK